MIGEPKGGEDWIWWKCELFGDRGLGCLEMKAGVSGKRCGNATCWGWEDGGFRSGPG